METKLAKFLAVGVGEGDNLDFSEQFYPVSADTHPKLKDAIKEEYTSWTDGSSVDKVAVYALIEFVKIKRETSFEFEPFEN